MYCFIVHVYRIYGFHFVSTGFYILDEHNNNVIKYLLRLFTHKYTFVYITLQAKFNVYSIVNQTNSNFHVWFFV